MKRHWKNHHKPFGKSYKPLKVFAHLLKALRKPLKPLEKPLTTRWLPVGFCSFNTKLLVYVFAWEVSYADLRLTTPFAAHGKKDMWKWLCVPHRCATNADCRLADRRPADLQTCRFADLQTRLELTGRGGGIIAPAGSIPRRHSSNSRVY